ncbi:hypothetical protein GOC91_04585 [Sinorhizobium medicae]|uniref:Transmembrane protein n=2 Tax=Sinorhizobium medicae TaxID=110321 RepID=A0A6G1WDP2_9HYPH|nr:hypothetical protein [Sinorhizobium medicae]ABR59207.1 conserved hypothetical protein [Sinorhizobium medicae WSM419]MBO1939267.1 hypothetical protein [Sinorhizobium medicae]MBO1963507.1 hypothetical protein [Sinorhizobium medicae]MDX0406229.1 hypothetical protein [Sinorhizobium medicae]MDX0417968.1 hypothetical protein [Sinorhizobium medicae]
MHTMNQHDELRTKPPLDPATGQPTPRDPDTTVVTTRRSRWPLMIIILAGLILALIAWLPAELTTDAENEPVAPSQSETAPSDTTPPAAPTDQPAPTNEAAPTDQATPPAGGTTAPAAPDTQTPAAPPAAPETQTPAAPAQPPAAPAQ